MHSERFAADVTLESVHVWTALMLRINLQTSAQSVQKRQTICPSRVPHRPVCTDPRLKPLNPNINPYPAY